MRRRGPLGGSWSAVRSRESVGCQRRHALAFASVFLDYYTSQAFYAVSSVSYRSLCSLRTLVARHYYFTFTNRTQMIDVNATEEMHHSTSFRWSPPLLLPLRKTVRVHVLAHSNSCLGFPTHVYPSRASPSTQARVFAPKQCMYRTQQASLRECRTRICGRILNALAISHSGRLRCGLRTICQSCQGKPARQHRTRIANVYCTGRPRAVR